MKLEQVDTSQDWYRSYTTSNFGINTNASSSPSACVFLNAACYISESDLIRPGKLKSQFIVTTFPVLHAGGRLLFRFQIQLLSSRVYRKPQTTNYKKTTDHRAVPAVSHRVTMESEKIWESPKFHADGDDKLWIQFAWPLNNAPRQLREQFLITACRDLYVLWGVSVACIHACIHSSTVFSCEKAG